MFCARLRRSTTTPPNCAEDGAGATASSEAATTAALSQRVIERRGRVRIVVLLCLCRGRKCVGPGREPGPAEPFARPLRAVVGHRRGREAAGVLHREARTREDEGGGHGADPE